MSKRRAHRSPSECPGFRAAPGVSSAPPLTFLRATTKRVRLAYAEDVLGLALVLVAAAGVEVPAVRFEPVPEPVTASDPCRDRGPTGRWVKMSEAGAPKSIHNEGWLDSAAISDGARVVVALRRNGKWKGTAFDPCANAWSPLAETTALARVEPWPSEGRDRPYLPLGSNGSIDPFDKVSVWDTARKAWVVVESVKPLAPRSLYAVAWAGQRLMVWGGWSTGVGVFGDGAVLDIARKTWKTMATAGAPSPRFAPAAVAWTGSRLLVWGGRFQGADYRTLRVIDGGAAYDPAGDRWTPMSSVNAPSPRAEATVVWTGRRLVVWGGAPLPGGTPLADGGVYDPATDRWTRLEAPPTKVPLPKGNVGPLTHILVAPDGRVVFLPDDLGKVVLLDADRARWSVLDADELGKRNSYRAFLLGRRLIVWGGVTVTAEHLCPPPVPGQPQCDPWAETASRDDGYMISLP